MLFQNIVVGCVVVILAGHAASSQHNKGKKKFSIIYGNMKYLSVNSAALLNLTFYKFFYESDL